MSKMRSHCPKLSTQVFFLLLYTWPVTFSWPRRVVLCVYKSVQNVLFWKLSFLLLFLSLLYHYHHYHYYTIIIIIIIISLSLLSLLYHYHYYHYYIIIIIIIIIIITNIIIIIIIISNYNHYHHLHHHYHYYLYYYHYHFSTYLDATLKYYLLRFHSTFRSCCGLVDKTMDSQQWGPSSILLAAAVVPLGKALYPHCLVPRKGLKAIGPLVACL